ncbi:MAG TPA: BatA domain-containing protein [Blastocatellia bacterium]|nr:BatA domain-containing protein [Blastocatellia bacterium]
MAFINPLFLLGVLAAAIPVAVHLVRRTRAPRVPFPSLMFIRQIEQKTIRRRKLRNLWLLALRCLALLLLALAFSRPYIAAGNHELASVAGTSVILLDVSYSMRYPGVFERARQAAQNVADSAAPVDRLALALFSSNCEVLRQPSENKAELKSLIDQAQPGFGPTDYTQALEAANSLLEEAGRGARKIYLISDFHQPGWDRTSHPPRLSRTVELIPIDASDPHPRNIAVLDVKAASEVYAQKYTGKVVATLSGAEPQSPGQSADPPIDATVELKLNDLTVERRQVRLEPGTTSTTEFTGFNVPEGSNRAAVEISGDDFAVDNSYYFAINRIPQTRILAIETASRGRSESFFLQQAMLASDASPYDLTVKTVGTVNPADLDHYRVVIINDASGVTQELATALKNFTARGGGLILATGKHTEAADFNRALGNLSPARVGDVVQARAGYSLISDMSIDHPVFVAFKKGGHMAPIRVYAYHKLEMDDRGTALASLDDGSPLIIEGLSGSGKVLMLGTTLDNSWTDLPITPVFLPLIHQVLDYLVGRGSASGYKIGQAIVASQATDGSTPQILDPRGEDVQAPAGKEGAQTVTASEAGFYRLNYHDRTEYVAVNLDTRESDLSRLDIAELTAAATADRKDDASMADDARLLTPADLESRQHLWIPLLLISLAMFVTEAILARRIRIARLVS